MSESEKWYVGEPDPHWVRGLVWSSVFGLLVVGFVGLIFFEVPANVDYTDGPSVSVTCYSLYEQAAASPLSIDSDYHLDGGEIESLDERGGHELTRVCEARRTLTAALMPVPAIGIAAMIAVWVVGRRRRQEEKKPAVDPSS